MSEPGRPLTKRVLFYSRAGGLAVRLFVLRPLGVLFSEPPPPAPRVPDPPAVPFWLRNSWLSTLIPALLFILFLALWFLLLPRTWRASGYSYLIILLLPAGRFVSDTFRSRGYRRYRDHIRDHDGRVCLHCSYSLEGLPDQHRCPECGEAYDIDNVRETWAAWFRGREGQPASGQKG